jgi:glycosyltransferase involved in cell wall biosynthesis
MIKVAFIKFGGLSAGGTERFLHTIAANLPREEFQVDFYYCDAAPYLGSTWKHPDTDIFRKKYLEDKKVNLIKFEVQYKDVRTANHDWVNTNFWNVFNEDNYDVIITGRAGHPEYPFYLIKRTPIINILTLNAGVDNQKNVFKSIHITKESGNIWVNSGGDSGKLDIIPVIQEMPNPPFFCMRDNLNIRNKFVFGFHQRNSEGLFSEVPLSAYKKIENDNTCFILLGGEEKYENQAKQLQLKNFIKLEHTGNSEIIHSFLETLDVFSHGRSDGETFGAVFTEAMFHKKPCISHKANSNGHVEVIGDGGMVFERNDIESYSKEMLKLMNDNEYYIEKSLKGFNRYLLNYSLESQIDKLTKLLKEAKLHGKYS